MTDRYVRSTDGSDADSGLTWALADATLGASATADSAGDRIFLSQVHAETQATSNTLTSSGVISSPVQILCGNDIAEPPATLATTATVSTTGASDININGHFYAYGIIFTAGDGLSAAIFRIGNSAGDSQYYENCSFRLGGSNSANRIYVVNASGSNPPLVKWKNVTVRFAGAAQAISVNGGFFEWEGGSIAAGGTNVTSLITSSTSGAATALISGVDLSGLSSTANLVALALSGLTVIFRNCKLPASWSGALATGTRFAAFRAEMHNCDNADTNYRIQIADFAGDLVQETTIVRTSGASDGTTALAWKMSSSANCNFYSGRFASPEIVKWNDAVGSSLTATIEIVHDSVTALNDDEVWLDIQYLGTSGIPLSLFATDTKADVLASATAQTSSSVTWTTTGITNVNKQKLVVTFTPQEKGFIHARIIMGKASYTIYVDPLLTVA